MRRVDKPRVWIITIGEPLIGSAELRHPHRSGRLAAALAADGWDVTWWTSSWDHFRKQRFSAVEQAAAQHAGVRVEFLSGGGYRSNVSLQRILDHIQVAREFSRRADASPRPDAMLVSLPALELAAVAARFGRRYSIPFAVDVRDLWPDVFETAVPAILRPLFRIALTPMRLMARASLRSATSIIGISDGYLHWGLRHAARSIESFDRVIPLSAEELDHDTSEPPAHAGPLRVTFVGTFGRSYDLSTIVAAVKLLSPQLQGQLRVTIAGDGEQMPAVRSAAAHVPCIELPGWQNADQVRGLLLDSDVGLAAYTASALQGIPNKLVEYMSAGLAVLSSLAGEGGELLERTGAGWRYQAESPAALASRLEFLIGNRSALEHARHAARRVHAEQFSSVIEVDSIRDLIQAMLRSEASTRGG